MSRLARRAAASAVPAAIPSADDGNVVTANRDLDWYKTSTHPAAVSRRQDIQTYFVEVPPGRWRQDLERRLNSHAESDYFSFCLELFIHHTLTAISGCPPTCHPILTGVNKHTDFLATYAGASFHAEAIVKFDAQKNRAWWDIFFTSGLATSGLTLGQFDTTEHPRRIWEAVSQKKDRYGTLNQPYIIIVWPLMEGALWLENAPLQALIGDKKWNLTALREERIPNGIFTEMAASRPKNLHVSAVGIYNEWATPSSYKRELAIIHNPHAHPSLDKGVFKQFPQLLAKVKGSNLLCRWSPHPPNEIALNLWAQKRADEEYKKMRAKGDLAQD